MESQNVAGNEKKSVDLEQVALVNEENKIDPAEIPLSVLLSKTNSKLDRILMSMGSDKKSQNQSSSLNLENPSLNGIKQSGFKPF